MGSRRIRIGEMLAIDASAIYKGVDGFFWLFGPSVTPSEMRGDVAIVHVRGALEHHEGGNGDSYEGILSRVREETAKKPAAVILCIDSPGGVVAGLNETVAALKKLRKESGVPLIAYVNEMSASAAYALACACDEIVCPPSAIVGSIGTISTMISQAAQDEAMGLDVRLITSGVRKADGHPHAPITDAAEEAERGRVEALALAFFKLASKARGLSVEKIRSLQAAIFLGTDAVKRKLADDLMGLDDVVLGLSKTPEEGAEAAGNETDRRADVTEPLDNTSAVVSTSTASRIDESPKEDAMAVKLSALIKKTEAALKDADPKKKLALEAQLAQFKATQAAMTAGEDPETGGDEDDDDEESDSEKKAKKAEESKKKAEAAKHKAKADEHRAKAADYDEAAKKCMGDDEEEAEAAAALAARPIGSVVSPGAAAALAGAAELVPDLVARVEAIEKGAGDREKKASIDAALVARRITPAEAKTLAKKDATFVADFLEMRPKAIVASQDDEIEVPDGTPGAHLGKEAMAAIEEALAAASDQTPAALKSLRESLLTAHINAATSRANGASTRY